MKVSFGSTGADTLCTAEGKVTSVRLRIATKLALLLVPLLLLPFATLGYFWYSATRSELEEQVRGELQARVRQFGLRLRPFLRERELDLHDIANSPAVTDYHTQIEYRLLEEAEVARTKLADYLGAFARVRREFVAQVRFLDEQGKEVAAATPDGIRRDRLTRFDLPFFQQARKAAPGAVLTLAGERSESLQIEVLRLGEPIYNRWNEFRGLLVVELSMQYIYTMLAEVLAGREGTHFLLGKGGGLLGPPGAQDALSAQWAGPRSLTPSLRSLAASSEAIQTVDLKGGQRAILVHGPVGLHGWSVGTLVSLAGTEGRVNALTRTAVTYGVIAGCFLIGVAALVAQGASRRVRRLQIATAQVARGHFSLRLPTQARDELGDLARSFNTMGESLARREAEVEARTQEAERRRQELEVLNTVIQAAHTSLDLTKSLEAILDSLMALLQFDVGAVRLLNEAQDMLEMAAHRGLNPAYVANPIPLRAGEGHMGQALRSGRPLVVSAPEELLEFRERVPEGVQIAGMLFIPVTAQGRSLGVIAVGAQRLLSFTAAELNFLASIGLEVGTAIQNARLYADLQAAYEQLKAAQEQALQVEKLRALGEMAAGVAHDFNNLLAAILARAQILQVSTTDPNVQRSLKVIEQAALDGAETVRRILGFARVRGQERMEVVEVEPLLRQVVEVARPRWKDEAQARGGAIEVQLDIDPLPAVRANGAEIREVLLNLIFNAVDAMPSGGTISIRARHHTARGTGTEEIWEEVAISVADTGTGMPDHVRRRAFDPFFTTKGSRGSGLGLSVAFGIVSRHDGKIEIDSIEGKGTTVTVRLPVAAADEDGPPPEVHASTTAARTARILVVDDEELLAESLAEILRLQGHSVESVTDPRLALRRLEADSVDVLFTDLGMPELTGWDLATQGRALRPNLPVVLVTGWGHQVDPHRVQACGICRVVAKPFRLQDIQDAVAVALEPVSQAA